MIVAAASSAPSKARAAEPYPNSIQVFACPFDDGYLGPFEQWPANWSRRNEPGYPAYLKIDLVAEPDGVRAIKMTLDGGAAEVSSPAIPINPHCDFVLDCLLRTDGLHHDEAYVTLTFLNEKRERLDSYEGPRIVNTAGWQNVRVGPVAPVLPGAAFAVIGLHLTPTGHQDLRGSASFANLRLSRLPRIQCATNRRQNIFIDPGLVELTCHLSGIAGTSPQLVLGLYDVDGMPLDTQELEIPSSSQAAPNDDGNQTALDLSFVHTLRWKPAVPGTGYYRISVDLKTDETVVHHREVTLAVIEPQARTLSGQFGWTIVGRRPSLAVDALAQLLVDAGATCVKYPVWQEDYATPQARETAWFFERMRELNIGCVALLAPAPESLLAPLRSRIDRPSNADVFTLPVEQWYPSVEGAMLQFGLQTRWWQICNDNDDAFASLPGLDEKVRTIKAQLDRLGQGVSVGLAWDGSRDPATKSKAPWQFVSLSSPSALTSDEVSQRLDATSKAPYQRWVSLTTLPAESNTLHARATNLAEQMIAAKVHDADRVFLFDPLNPDTGVLSASGSPGELFLPWRTIAMALSGARHLGSLVLYSGSHNHVFSRDGQIMLVAWNHEPVEELLCLGAGARQVDLWGRIRPIETSGDEHLVSIGPSPTIIYGMHPVVASIALNFTLEQARIPNMIDMEHGNAFSLRNVTTEAIDGRLRIVPPDDWHVQPHIFDLHIKSDAELKQPFGTMLDYNAVTGKQLVRIDFELASEPKSRFSIYRQVEAGSGDVTLDVASRFDDLTGGLDVEVRMTNRTELPVSYHCDLFAPDRRRARVDILNLVQGEAVRVYHLDDAADLAGEELRVRAQEIGGRRMLNCRLVAEP